MPEFAPIINVSELNGTNGFRLIGQTGVQAGFATAGAGDMDGDGFTDVIVGAPGADIGGNSRGLAYIAFGAASHAASSGFTAEIAAGNAYRLLGETEGDNAGFSVDGAGDVNGDGFDDVIIGARIADLDVPGERRGASYVVFGGTAKLEALDTADGANNNLITLGELTPATGFRFDGVAGGDYAGQSVAGAGDVNGDGFADLIIGALFADTIGTDNGASYLVFGGTAKLNDLDNDDGAADGRIDLAQLSAGKGMRIDGASLFGSNVAGTSVSAAGDVNGDGFDDVIIGAPFANPNGTETREGAAYIVFGRATTGFPATLSLNAPNGLDSTRLDGIDTNDQTGNAVRAAGDINGDGFADVIIGAHRAYSNGFATGSAFVVFGRTGWGPSFDLSRLDGSNGFRLDGLRPDDNTAKSVSSAGDVNGDGFADLLVSADEFARLGVSNVGAAYVVFGKADGFAPVIDLGQLDGNDGFRIEGAATGDFLGAVGTAGDVNGDGFDDIIAGAYLAGAGNTGSTYVIYGHRSETAVTRIGTETNNTINGGKEDDSLSGRSGNDRLIGWEGDDVIAGESGNDRLDGGDEDDLSTGAGGNDTFLASRGEDTVRGGSGTDTLEFVNLLGTAVTANLATGTIDFDNGTGSIAVATVERLFAGDAADTVTGNARGNFLHGRAGNDSINGGGGGDTLTGGLGADTLNGSSGGDIFDYNAIADTGIAASTRDRIVSFAVNADRIDLATIDAVPGGANNAFVFRGASAFSAAGQVRLSQSGADTIVEINTVGTSVAEATILLTAITATTLDAGEFIL